MRSCVREHSLNSQNKQTALQHKRLYCLHFNLVHSYGCTGKHVPVRLCAAPLHHCHQKSTLAFVCHVANNICQTWQWNWEGASPSHGPVRLNVWQYLTHTWVWLEQPSLLLQLVPFPQSQPVKILHGHAEHLDELFWGQVALRRQRHKNCVILSFLHLEFLHIYSATI